MSVKVVWMAISNLCLLEIGKCHELKKSVDLGILGYHVVTIQKLNLG